VRTTIPVFFIPFRTFLSSPAWQRRARYIFPLLAYAALIFYGSSQSRWFFEPPDFFSSDKIYHFLEYGIFGVLLARTFQGYDFPLSFRGKMIWVLVISFLYGASDEFHQWFIPGRFATFGDLLADSLGGGVSGFIFLKLKRKGFHTDLRL
jgi:hypothetical protein